MKPGRMHRKERPAGQRGSLFKGLDAAERLPGFIPSGEGWRGGSDSMNEVNGRALRSRAHQAEGDAASPPAIAAQCAAPARPRLAEPEPPSRVVPATL